MKQKESDRVFFWIGVVLLSFLSWIIAFFMIYNNGAFYSQAFQDSGVYDRLGNESVSAFHPAILGFLTKKDFDYSFPSFLVDYLDPSERSHLVDVKRLLSLLDVAFYAALLGFIGIAGRFVYRKHFHILGNIMVDSGFVSLASLLLVFLGTLFFDSFFTVFHWIFFPMGNYAFPATSILIQLYPESLFLSLLETISGIVLLSGVILVILGCLLKKEINY